MPFLSRSFKNRISNGIWTTMQLHFFNNTSICSSIDCCIMYKWSRVLCIIPYCTVLTVYVPAVHTFNNYVTGWHHHSIAFQCWECAKDSVAYVSYCANELPKNHGSSRFNWHSIQRKGRRATKIATTGQERSARHDERSLSTTNCT